MAMSLHEKAAEEFCKSTGTRIRIAFKEFAKFYDNDRQMRNIYRIRIERNGMRYCFDYRESAKNTLDGIIPTKYDVLASLDTYMPECEDVWDFAKEHNYKIQDRESYNRVNERYNAAIVAYDNVSKLFGDVMFQLSEIK